MKGALTAAVLITATSFFPVQLAELADDPAGAALDVAADADVLLPAALDLVDGAGDDDDAAEPAGEVRPWTGRAKLTAFAPGCGDSGLTKTGTRPAWGTVAVDPRVIRLYSRLEIEGFEGTTFTALDTGFGVLGQHIDVWLSSCQAARQFGVQSRAYRVVA